MSPLYRADCWINVYKVGPPYNRQTVYGKPWPSSHAARCNAGSWDTDSFEYRSLRGIKPSYRIHVRYVFRIVLTNVDSGLWYRREPSDGMLYASHLNAQLGNNGVRQ